MDVSSSLDEQLLGLVEAKFGSAEAQSPKDATLSALLVTVGNLLGQHETSDAVSIEQQYPKVGQALALLAKLPTNQANHDLLLDNLRWFQSNSEVPAKKSLSRQSQRLIRSLVTFPQEFNGMLEIVPLPSLISKLQWRLSKQLDGHSVDDNQLELLCCLGSRLLCENGTDDLSSDGVGYLLEAIIRQCPEVDSRDKSIGSFFETVGKAIDCQRGTFSDSLLDQLARRHPVFVENQIVALFENWTRNGVSSLKDCWLISFAAGQKKRFQDVCCILHSLLVKMEYDFVARSFVNAIMARVNQETPLHQLYPESYASVLILLDIEPKDLPAHLIKSHSVTVMNTVLQGLATQTFDVFSVAILSCHYSEWWSHLQGLSEHPDRQVRMNYCLHENIVFGTSLITTYRRYAGT